MCKAAARDADLLQSEVRDDVRRQACPSRPEELESRSGASAAAARASRAERISGAELESGVDTTFVLIIIIIILSTRTFIHCIITSGPTTRDVAPLPPTGDVNR